MHKVFPMKSTMSQNSYFWMYLQNFRLRWDPNYIISYWDINLVNTSPHYIVIITKMIRFVPQDFPPSVWILLFLLTSCRTPNKTKLSNGLIISKNTFLFSILLLSPTLGQNSIRLIQIWMRFCRNVNKDSCGKNLFWEEAIEDRVFRF